MNFNENLNDNQEVRFIYNLYLEGNFDECIRQCKKIITRNPNSISAEKAREIVSKIKAVNLNIDESINRKQCNEARVEYNERDDLLSEALVNLNSLIGLGNVKLEIERIINLIKYEKYRNSELGILNDKKQTYHFMFLGNPGTGKTTVARLIGDILFSLNLLEKGHIVEVDRSAIVGQYIGQTAILMKDTIEKAIGGVLFIDEAYALASKSTDNDFGPEAINTLVKYMEDYRGEFVVILAGYTREMNDLMKLNPGLKSRINMKIEFPDYNDEELIEIAKSIAEKKRYYLNANGIRAFQEKINDEKIYDYFGNARTVRNIIEAAIRQKAYRLAGKKVSREELIILEPEDFGVDISLTSEDKINNLMYELNSMIGLDNVKESINKIISYVQLQEIRKNLGKKYQDICLNMVFTGNPGTGKTTIARIVSNVLKDIGILKKGHLVEVTREDLVGKYVGQTAPKTLEKIKEAYGGVLFIDEAYSLYSNEGNDFGMEAINTLIREMEECRDKLVVIMAGYTEEMKYLLNSNAGLLSRIGFEIEFKDYSPEEMIEIFKGLCIKEEYILTEAAQIEVHKYFKDIYENRTRSFGNGRFVRKFFETVKMNQADRIISNNLSSDEIMFICSEDIKIKNI